MNIPYRPQSMDRIAGIRYGFGDKHSLVPRELHALDADWPVLHQRHSTTIVKIEDREQTNLEADGLITSLQRVTLSVMSADCVPILFARGDGKRVAVVHAGWRGLIEGIIGELARTIEESEEVGEWLALVGPSAGPCCYEVGEDFLQRFSHQSGLDVASLSRGGGTHLDLQGVATHYLRKAGFRLSGSVTGCTMCSRTEEREDYRFNSYRRNIKAQPDAALRTPTSNQLSGIVIL